MTSSSTHAMVLGASMSGLLAARVLSDFFDTVTVVERDVLPDGPANRRGVPQDSHAHLLLARGAQILADLFPGILEELVAEGVPVWDDGDLSKQYVSVGGHRLMRDGRLRRPLRDYHPSRVLLEDHVRRRVLAIPNVTVLDGREVVELTSAAKCDRVTGAVIADRSTHEKSVLTAALVVDATGRGSRTPLFLERLGYGRPHEDVLAVRISYTSQSLHLPRARMPAEVVGVFPESHRPIAFAWVGNEGDRSVLSVGSLGERGPAEQYAEMLSLLARFAPADVMDALRTAKPIGKASTYRVPSNRWRRYDKMRRIPEGLIVVGDAFCGFNPIYGQGMTIAALEAIALRDCLRQGRSDLPRRFFGAAAKKIRVAWQTAVSSDVGLPGVTGARPLTMRLTHAYLNRVLTAAEFDPVVTEQFIRVNGMIDPPARLFRPAMVFRVAMGQNWFTARRPPVGSFGRSMTGSRYTWGTSGPAVASTWRVRIPWRRAQ
jgi:2-polyprenyl-6-methoxyphenol hydroxylase-like FAD-dependent oxidoreductase